MLHKEVDVPSLKLQGTVVCHRKARTGKETTNVPIGYGTFKSGKEFGVEDETLPRKLSATKEQVSLRLSTGHVIQRVSVDALAS